jgi:Domain of unknown function (DUF6429)
VELDTSKIDDAVLALLYLGLHDGARAWKGFDWDAMDRLHQAGLISEPRGRAKSVVFTEVGLERAERLLEELFGKRA